MADAKVPGTVIYPLIIFCRLYQRRRTTFCAFFMNKKNSLYLFPIFEGMANVTMGILKMTKRRLLSLILLFAVFGACAQVPALPKVQVYKIDARIKDTVAQKVWLSDGTAYSTIDLKIFMNDSVVLDTYADRKSLEEAIALTRLHGDTLSITGSSKLYVYFSYRIDLFKDTCIVSVVTTSDIKDLKLKMKDPLTDSIRIRSTGYYLMLAKKPTFKKDEIVEGVIDLAGADFYQVVDGKTLKYNINLKSYFSTRPWHDVPREHK